MCQAEKRKKFLTNSILLLRLYEQRKMWRKLPKKKKVQHLQRATSHWVTRFLYKKNFYKKMSLKNQNILRKC